MPRLMHKEEPLDVVRDLFFETELGHPIRGNTEKISFLGPDLKNGTDHSYRATNLSLINFINYYERHIETIKLYLSNGRDNNSSNWRVGKLSPRYWYVSLRAFIWKKRLLKQDRTGAGFKDDIKL